MVKKCHKLTSAIAAVSISLACHAHPIEDAAQVALEMCKRIDPEQSLEECGASMPGKSTERTAARMAVKRLIELRNDFVKSCTDSEYICLHRADWYMGSGMSRVLNTPVQYQ